jgi:hypothetical protein
MSHTWKVAALDYAVSQDGLSNVVTVVHWTCSKEDHGLPEPDPSNFTVWDDLDESTVLSWMTANMVAQVEEGEETEVDRVQASVDAQIAEKANPTNGTGVPW